VSDHEKYKDHLNVLEQQEELQNPEPYPAGAGLKMFTQGLARL